MESLTGSVKVLRLRWLCIALTRCAHWCSTPKKMIDFKTYIQNSFYNPILKYDMMNYVETEKYTVVGNIWNIFIYKLNMFWNLVDLKSKRPLRFHFGDPGSKRLEQSIHWFEQKLKYHEMMFHPTWLHKFLTRGLPGSLSNLGSLQHFAGRFKRFFL